MKTFDGGSLILLTALILSEEGSCNLTITICDKQRNNLSGEKVGLFSFSVFLNRNGYLLLHISKLLQNEERVKLVFNASVHISNFILIWQLMEGRIRLVLFSQEYLASTSICWRQISREGQVKGHLSEHYLITSSKLTALANARGFRVILVVL